VGISEQERARLVMTVSCQDTDVIPKAPGAGSVVEGVQIMHNGVRVVENCYYGEWMTELIRRLQGHHEPQEELVFHEVVERLARTSDSPVILELGSFWAYYSAWFLKRIPSGQAFLVEPDPNNLAVGQRNFALNGMEGVFLQAAVGAGATPPEGFWCESDDLERRVPREGLASLLDRFNLEKVDIVLADVQGAETPLLEGAESILSAGRVRFLIVSTHHHSISGDPLTHQRCLELLQSVGAHIIAEHSVAESYSGDGLIAVSFERQDRDLQVPVSRARPEESLFGNPLHDLARAVSELKALETRLAEAQEQLAAVIADYARKHSELVTVTSTRTWRLRCRILALLSDLGLIRTVQRVLG
jgi:FkbM family methyltransferase